MREQFCAQSVFSERFSEEKGRQRSPGATRKLILEYPALVNLQGGPPSYQL